jgi:hypothetical protein
MPEQTPKATPTELTRSQTRFVEAPEHIQRLIRQVLSEERQVMHLSSRTGTGIYQKLLDQVKSVVR